jgi:hypothetical protein
MLQFFEPDTSAQVDCCGDIFVAEARMAFAPTPFSLAGAHLNLPHRCLLSFLGLSLFSVVCDSSSEVSQV